MIPAIMSAISTGMSFLKNKNAPEVGGVQSVMNNQQPQTPTQAQPQGGSLLKDLGDELKSTGISAVTDPLKAKISGKANKSYLANSFPDLNPWEAAGASATQAGTAMAEQRTKTKLQKAEFQQQKDLQKQELKTRKEIATEGFQNQAQIAIRNNAAQVQAADLNSLAQRSVIEENRRKILADGSKSMSQNQLAYSQAIAVSQRLQWETTSQMNKILNDLYYGEIDKKEAGKRLAVLGISEAGSIAGDFLRKFGKGGSKGKKKLIDDYPVIE